MKKGLLACLAAAAMLLFSAGALFPNWDSKTGITTTPSGTQTISGTVLINDTNLDTATDAVLAIEYEHHEIHGGSSYGTSITQMVSDTNDRTIIAFTTPNTTKWLHVTFEFVATDLAQVWVWENPTVTDNTGTPQTVINHNRNSCNVTSIIDTSQNPDVAGQATYFNETTASNVSGGTSLFTMIIGTGNKNNTGGGETRGEREFILKQNENYAFEVKSLNANDNYHSVLLNWYEHTNH